MQTYTVEAGDTLYGISKQFGVPVEDIKKENNLATNTITVGQQLKIPTTNTSTIYIVKKGDSLYKIAQDYDTTVNEIIALNNLTSNILSIGQQLKIPTKSPTNNDITYIVKNGDSLYSIAIKYNTSIQAIKEYNNLIGDALTVGQTLKIPNNTITTIIYTVRPNDTLYSIATKYNTRVDEIKNINNLTSDLLSVGQILQIPVTNSNQPSLNTYIVQAGDSLYKIAKEHNMSVDELMRLNNLTTTVLTIGQVLNVKNSNTSQIPSGAECVGTGYVEPTYEVYTVKKGDSLYTIARKFNTSIDNLKLLNNLKTDNLSVGQILRIKEVS